MDRKNHWDNIYKDKPASDVSWYQSRLEKSLALIRTTGVDRNAEIIDVGGGTSTLADDLLSAGFQHVTVLDVSLAAIQSAQTRLGARAKEITWLEADITQATLPEHRYDVWHDRAVFHFLTNPQDRRRYVDAVNHALKPGGHLIVATFGPQGPLQCSGLDIVRYTPEQLHDELGERYTPMQSLTEDHVTPVGKHQEFVYCYFRKQQESSD